MHILELLQLLSIVLELRLDFCALCSQKINEVRQIAVRKSRGVFIGQLDIDTSLFEFPMGAIALGKIGSSRCCVGVHSLIIVLKNY